MRQKDGKEETQLTWTSRQWVRLPGTCPAKLSSALWNQTCCKWKWRKCSVPLALEAMMCEKWLKDQGPFNPKGGKFEGTRCPALRGWHEAGAEVSSRLRGGNRRKSPAGRSGPKGRASSCWKLIHSVGVFWKGTSGRLRLVTLEKLWKGFFSDHWSGWRSNQETF